MLLCCLKFSMLSFDVSSAQELLIDSESCVRLDDFDPLKDYPATSLRKIPGPRYLTTIPKSRYYFVSGKHRFTACESFECWSRLNLGILDQV